jgi:hypothetical protein
MAKRLTRQGAINAKCKDCQYDSAERGNWKQQVTDCQGTDCPLYAYRPVSRAASRTASGVQCGAVQQLCEGSCHD